MEYKNILARESPGPGKRSGGRPKKVAEERRTARLPQTRLTEAEFSYLEGLVAMTPLSSSEFCRRAVLGQKIQVNDPLQSELIVKLSLAIVALNRAGGNLHQIARAVNRGRVPDQDIIGPILADFGVLVADLKSQLKAQADDYL